MFFQKWLIKQKLATGKPVHILGLLLILVTSMGMVQFWDGLSHAEKVKESVLKAKKTPLGLTQNVLGQQNLINLPAPMKQAQNDNGLPNPKPQQVSKNISQSQPFEHELPILARIIHAEAGGESLKGQVAVGAVLLNRIKSGQFPRTLAANVFRPGEFESVSNGYIWSNPTSASYQAARLALNGWDPTSGALYFFNPAKTHSRWIWGRPIHTIIGQHNFAG
jgi:spore germination cell wall hydrolase CwlJ-like protein